MYAIIDYGRTAANWVTTQVNNAVQGVVNAVARIYVGTCEEATRLLACVRKAHASDDFRGAYHNVFFVFAGVALAALVLFAMAPVPAMGSLLFYMLLNIGSMAVVAWAVAFATVYLVVRATDMDRGGPRRSFA